MSYSAKSGSGVPNNVPATGQQQSQNPLQGRHLNDNANIAAQFMAHQNANQSTGNASHQQQPQTQQHQQQQQQQIANNIQLMNAASGGTMTPSNLQQLQFQQQQFATLQQTALLLQQQQFLLQQQQAAQQNATNTNEPLAMTRTLIAELQSRAQQQGNGNANMSAIQQMHQLLQTTSGQGQTSLLNFFQQAQQQMAMPFQSNLANLANQNVTTRPAYPSAAQQSATTQPQSTTKQVPLMQQQQQMRIGQSTGLKAGSTVSSSQSIAQQQASASGSSVESTKHSAETTVTPSKPSNLPDSSLQKSLASLGFTSAADKISIKITGNASHDADRGSSKDSLTIEPVVEKAEGTAVTKTSQSQFIAPAHNVLTETTNVSGEATELTITKLPMQPAPVRKQQQFSPAKGVPAKPIGTMQPKQSPRKNSKPIKAPTAVAVPCSSALSSVVSPVQSSAASTVSSTSTTTITSPVASPISTVVSSPSDPIVPVAPSNATAVSSGSIPISNSPSSLSMTTSVTPVNYVATTPKSSPAAPETATKPIISPAVAGNSTESNNTSPVSTTGTTSSTTSANGSDTSSTTNTSTDSSSADATDSLSQSSGGKNSSIATSTPQKSSPPAKSTPSLKISSPKISNLNLAVTPPKTPLKEATKDTEVREKTSPKESSVSASVSIDANVKSLPVDNAKPKAPSTQVIESSAITIKKSEKLAQSANNNSSASSSSDKKVDEKKDEKSPILKSNDNALVLSHSKISSTVDVFFTKMADESKQKRHRFKTVPYQSPIPEVEFVTKLSVTESKQSPLKAGTDRLVLFYKGEFLAVRNADSGFFLCQTLHNVYKSSPRIRIRWLSEQPKSDGIYVPDFYDITDLECVLTSLDLGKANKTNYRLSAKEKERIENILKKAIDVEKGILPKPDVTEENPDGLDLSLYKDESQIDRRTTLKRKSKTPVKAKTKVPKSAIKSNKKAPTKRKAIESDDEDYSPKKKRELRKKIPSQTSTPKTTETLKRGGRRGQSSIRKDDTQTVVTNSTLSSRASRSERRRSAVDDDSDDNKPLITKLTPEQARKLKETPTSNSVKKKEIKDKKDEKGTSKSLDSHGTATTTTRQKTTRGQISKTTISSSSMSDTPSTSSGRRTRNSRH